MRWILMGALCVLGVFAFVFVWDGPAGADEKTGSATAPIHVRLDGKGVVTATRAGKGNQEVTLARVDLGAEKHEAQAKALEKLKSAFTAVMEDKRLRMADGSSNLLLLIEAEGDARWQWIQWVMMVGAHPDVQIWRLELRREEAKTGTRIDLPKDRGLAPGAIEEYSKVKLKLFRKNPQVPSESFTRVRIDRDKRDTVDFPPSGRTNGYDEDYAKAAKQIEAIFKRKLGNIPKDDDLKIELATLPPSGGFVPYQDVMEMIEMVRRHTKAQILFEGAPFPPMSASMR